jgi:hypothetical protein
MTTTTAAVADAPDLPAPAEDAHLRTARKVFLGCLAYTVAMSVFWAGALIVGPAHVPIFGNYKADLAKLRDLAFYFVFFVVLWGWLWYGIRALLLRRWVGMTRDEVRTIFTSRMHTPFDVSSFTAKYSERRIRITDMIGRRGRFITLACLGVVGLYLNVRKDPTPQNLLFGYQDNLFSAVALSWLYIAFYYSDGFFGRVAYGAQTRLMDGQLGRANCLLITTLWNGFNFVMVPLSVALGARLPKETYAVAFMFIWGSYVAADALSEIVGSMFGRQRLKVWGLGDVNKKSVEGTVAGFLGALVVCLSMVWAWHLPPAWIALAVVVALSNCLLELYSPRGTDDFTMAVGNGLLLLAFARIVY